MKMISKKNSNIELHMTMGEFISLSYSIAQAADTFEAKERFYRSMATKDLAYRDESVLRTAIEVRKLSNDIEEAKQSCMSKVKINQK